MYPCAIWLASQIAHGYIREKPKVANIPDRPVQLQLVEGVALDQLKFAPDHTVDRPHIIHNFDTFNKVLLCTKELC